MPSLAHSCVGDTSVGIYQDSGAPHLWEKPAAWSLHTVYKTKFKENQEHQAFVLPHTPIPQSEAPSVWLALDIGTCGDQPPRGPGQVGASPQSDFPAVSVCFADRDLQDQELGRVQASSPQPTLPGESPTRTSQMSTSPPACSAEAIEGQSH